MGQLERYGLYVLVLVIFLILGVAIWGHDPREVEASSRNSNLEARLGSGEPLRVDDEDDRRLSEAFGGHFEPVNWDEESTSDDEADNGLNFEALVSDVQPDPQSVQPKPVDSDKGRTDVPPAPIPGKQPPPLREHKIAAGETLSEISKRYLGRALEHNRILQLNPDLNPKSLPIGRVIKIPHRRELLGNLKGGEVPPVGKYVVQKGDSPARISKRLFGTEKYTNDILRANGLTKADAKKIQPGRVLVVPSVEED